jgi:hypothetical protein
LFPLLSLFTFLLLGAGNTWWARLVTAATAIVAIVQVGMPGYAKGQNYLLTGIVNPAVGYCSTLFTKEFLMQDPNFQLADSTLNTIGRSPVDIMPIDISLLLQHGLNYSPRPVIQSFAAYSPQLDSLNAGHFAGPSAPRFVLASYRTIHDKYPQWEESLTKCVLHLDYEVVSMARLKNYTDSDATHNFLLLQSGTKHIWPRFTKVGERTVNMGDTFEVNDTGSLPLYFIADVDYTAGGKVTGLLFQPPVIYVSLTTAGGATIRQRIVRSMLGEPVLIGRLVWTNTDFRNFLSGNIKACPRIVSAAFHTTAKGCEKNIHLTFYRFSNY